MKNESNNLIIKQVESLVKKLNELDLNSITTSRGYVGWNFKDRKKFIAIDCNGSGYFLVEKETGELFNIKAYGVPDRNKKLKADIGNIKMVDPRFLLTKRYNYLK